MSSFPGFFSQFFVIEKSEIFSKKKEKTPPFFCQNTTRFVDKKIHSSIPLGQIDHLSTHLNHFVIKLCTKVRNPWSGFFFFGCDQFPQE